MAASIEESSPLPRTLALKNKALTIKLVSARRAVLAVTATLALMVLAPTRIAQQDCSTALNPECPALGNKIDIAFIIDRSGSMALNQVGQTYNIEVEGVVRALRDPSVIPRDKSTAVSVWTLAGSPVMVVPLQEIDSAADAEAIATIVEGLKCTAADCNPTGLCPFFGSNPASNYAPAISNVYKHLSENHRTGARQALLLSSDGQPTDMPFPVFEANNARAIAANLGIQLELDIILMTLDPNAKEDTNVPESEEEKRFKAFHAAKEIADQIVFPRPTDDLPGKTIVITRGDCNNSCASLSDGAVRADCDRQIREFAENTRDVIRSSVPAIPPLIVKTEFDPLPNTPVTGGIFSLRQAIEFANCNGGAAAITFAKEVNTISPRVPLPALTAPEITIDGLAGRTALTPVTIDGSKTDTTSGEHHSAGILIRSTRDEVRGMRIINFDRSGVEIGTGCPTDNVGSSLIKLNTFENNKEAGVSVIDPQPGELAAVFHNVGNTISMNDISGSATPIDLALDGPTPNDPGDLDEGPNTLLNFPDTLAVSEVLEATVNASGVTLTGQVSGSAAAGAIVEIFKITSFKQVSGTRVIDGVSFLVQTKTDSNGMFSVSGLGDSPTCAYTATVTDSQGNTSELRFPCSGLARGQILNNELVLRPDALPGGNKLIGEFTVENIGCESLVLNSFSVTRTGVDRGRLSDGDDRAHFSMDELSVKPFQGTVTVDPGQTRILHVSFDPTIPRFRTGSQVTAADTLPNLLTATLTLHGNGCVPMIPIDLTAKVQEKIFLINPQDTQAAPRVILQRSGDVFTVTYFIFDSNKKDIQTVDYEFFKSNHKKARVKVTDNDLTKAIDLANPVNGKSLRVIQTFSGADAHPNVASVVVTVMGRNSSDTSTGMIELSGNAASVQSFGSSQTAVVILPTQKLVPVRNDRLQRMRERGRPKMPLRAATRQEEQR